EVRAADPPGLRDRRGEDAGATPPGHHHRDARVVGAARPAQLVAGPTPAPADGGAEDTGGQAIDGIVAPRLEPREGAGEIDRTGDVEERSHRSVSVYQRRRA